MVHSLILKNAHAVLEHGIPPAFPKSYYIKELAAHAEVIRAPGESVAKAFMRAITEDDVGRTLYKASKTAKGPEVEGAAVQDFVGPPPSAGPAHDAMQRLADAHNQKNTGKTPAQSYASVYSDPKNSELRQRVVAEHLAPRPARDAPDQQGRESDRRAGRRL